jgi:hypothetical protein
MFEVFDTRTDRRVGPTTYTTQALAQSVVDRAIAHRRCGRRRDLIGKVEYWDVRASDLIVTQSS